jgi:hypothetical protein
MQKAVHSTTFVETRRGIVTTMLDCNTLPTKAEKLSLVFCSSKHPLLHNDQDQVDRRDIFWWISVAANLVLVANNIVRKCGGAHYLIHQGVLGNHHK